MAWSFCPACTRHRAWCLEGPGAQLRFGLRLGNARERRRRGGGRARFQLAGLGPETFFGFRLPGRVPAGIGHRAAGVKDDNGLGEVGADQAGEETRGGNRLGLGVQFGRRLRPGGRQALLGQGQVPAVGLDQFLPRG